MRLLKEVALLCGTAAVMTAACGDESSGSLPTAASPTTSAITVTVNNPIKVADTAQAVATASISSGQTQTISSGWQSDAPGVASVTDAGLVTGVANGRATIYVVSGGRQGQQVVRVVPNYDGQWAGLLRVTSCTQTGAWASVGFCDGLPVGGASGFTLGLSQTGESLTARAAYPPEALFPSVTAAIDANGNAAFTSTFRTTSTPVLTLEAAWRIASAGRGVLSGTVSEVWTAAGVSGEGRLVQDIAGATRVGGTTATRTSDSRMRMLGDRIQRLR